MTYIIFCTQYNLLGAFSNYFQKRELPMYILLKQSQRIEVVASSLPDTIDLNHLKRYLPAFVDGKLYQVDTVLWSKLDLVYGRCCNLWEKLQEGLLYISLSAKTSPYFVIETLGEVYKLASRIRATSSFQLLPCDFEYTTIQVACRSLQRVVVKHNIKFSLLRWILLPFRVYVSKSTAQKAPQQNL